MPVSRGTILEHNNLSQRRPPAGKTSNCVMLCKQNHSQLKRAVCWQVPSSLNLGVIFCTDTSVQQKREPSCQQVHQFGQGNGKLRFFSCIYYALIRPFRMHTYIWFFLSSMGSFVKSIRDTYFCPSFNTVKLFTVLPWKWLCSVTFLSTD